MDQENNTKMRQGWHYKINEILGDKENIVVFDPTSEFESINGQLLTKGIELDGSINPLEIKRIDKFVTKYWPNNRRKLNNLSMRRKSINYQIPEKEIEKRSLKINQYEERREEPLPKF